MEESLSLNGLNALETIIVRGTLSGKGSFEWSDGGNLILKNATLLAGDEQAFKLHKSTKIHVEGDVELSESLYYINEVNLYNGSVLTIGKNATVDGEGWATKLTVNRINKNAFGGTAGTKATGKVVNRGTVWATVDYSAEDEDGEPVYSWWSGTCNE